MSDPIPLCRGHSALFDSIDEDVHKWCARLCAVCPLLEACKRHRDDALAKELPIEGTWAGALYGGRREPVHRRQCGTHAGPALHRKAGEWTCDECLAFRQRYERERYIIRKQAASA